jgi:hypothetical protein
VRRRALEIGLPVAAVAILAVILYNATLVDRRPPSVTHVALSAPAGDPHKGQTLTAIDVEFSEPVRTASVETRFTITPHVPGAVRWDGQRTLIFTPSQRLPAATAFQIAIDAGFEDLAGNAATAAMEPWSFETAGPPAVSAFAPEGLAVPVDTTVQVTFDRLMATSAVEQAITIAPRTAYHASWSQQVLTLTFDAPLAFGTTYTVTVGTGATDTDGSHMAVPFSSRFSTVAAGLSVLSTAPADGVSGANPRGSIAVIFDAPIDPQSTADALIITPPIGGSASVVELPDDRPVPAPSGSPSPSQAPAGRALVFTPNAALPAHTTYTVTLRPVVRSLAASGQVAAGRTWTFTTGQPIASAQNQVMFLTARGGVRNLWLMNPDGSNPRQLTSSLSPLVGYDVTIDGQSIAYSAAGIVRVVRVDGSDERILTGPDRIEYAPQFAPDGRSLIVGRRGADGTDQGWWLVPVPGRGSGDERRLLADGAPAAGSATAGHEGIETAPGGSPWAPRAAFDGDGTVALLATGDGTLQLIDLSGPVATSARLSLTATSVPAWSSAGQAFLVAATSATEPTPGVWLVRPSGAATRLFAGAGPIATSSQGALAALRPGPGAPEPLHIAYLASEGADPGPLTTASDLSDRTPVFSPNGQDILFVRVTIGEPAGSAGIWVVGTDGRDLRQLTRDGAEPRWLP